MPTAAATPTAMTTAPGDTMVAHLSICLTESGGHQADDHADHAACQAQRHRFGHELQHHVAARAPSAMRMPISRVRSVTDSSITFMIPMPPTSSDTLATLASSAVIVRLDRSIVCDSCSSVTDSSPGTLPAMARATCGLMPLPSAELACVLTTKSSGAASAMPWRARSSAVTSLETRVVSAADFDGDGNRVQLRQVEEPMHRAERDVDRVELVVANVALTRSMSCWPARRPP